MEQEKHGEKPVHIPQVIDGLDATSPSAPVLVMKQNICTE